MSTERAWIGTAVLSGGLVLVMALVFWFAAPESLPDKPTEPAPAPQEDTGRVMDLEHLSEADLRFLEGVLADPENAEGRRSAMRALVVSGDLRGAPILFAQSNRPAGEGTQHCLAALEILRMQRFENAARVLVLARDQPLSQECRAEVDTRLALLARDHANLLMLSGAPEAEVRRWLCAHLSDMEGDLVDAALADLAQDEDTSVRRAAWMAIDARAIPPDAQRLRAWAAQEPDPGLRALAQEVVAEW